MRASLSEIFKVFFIIGCQLLGGGYVILPLLKKYISDERHWLSSEELTDFFALSQCLPGIIAGNISVCAGYKMRGILGAFAAISGIALPCIISIIIIAGALTDIMDYTAVQSAFKGIRISVIVLILVTIKELWSKSANSLFTYILFSASAAALFFIKISPAVIIVCAGIAALLYGRLSEKAETG